jgi:hypothetical protein
MEEKFLVVETYGVNLTWISIHKTQYEAVLAMENRKAKLDDEECLMILPVSSFYQKQL